MPCQVVGGVMRGGRGPTEFCSLEVLVGLVEGLSEISVVNEAIVVPVQLVDEGRDLILVEIKHGVLKSSFFFLGPLALEHIKTRLDRLCSWLNDCSLIYLFMR